MSPDMSIVALFQRLAIALFPLSRISLNSFWAGEMLVNLGEEIVDDGFVLGVGAVAVDVVFVAGVRNFVKPCVAIETPRDRMAEEEELVPPRP